MIRRPPRSTRTDTLFPYTTLFRSTDKLLVGLIPIGHDLELGAIPLDDAGPVVAHVVAARCLDRTHQLGEAQLFKAFLGDVQVLETPANLLARHVLALAVFFLGGAYGFDLQHGDHHAARVCDGAHILAVGIGTLTLVVHVLFQVFVHLAVVGAVMDGDAVVALGDRTEVLDVVFGTGPPDAVHFVARIADGLRRAYRSEEHTYKLQSLMRSSYAVICLKKKNKRIF